MILQYGEAFADAYLEIVDHDQVRDQIKRIAAARIPKQRRARIFLIAGGRCIEGEEVFIAQLSGKHRRLGRGLASVSYRAILGGGTHQSMTGNHWAQLDISRQPWSGADAWCSLGASSEGTHCIDQD